MNEDTYDVQKLFNDCLNINAEIPDEIKTSVDTVIEFSEKQKGVLTVIVTGYVYKYFHPDQDVRYHQSNMDGGYSGRTFDNKHITPFMRENNFPSMAESGWLTRSLEQNVPYESGYPGKISGKGIKESFLLLYDATQTYETPLNILSYLFQQLVRKRDDSQIQLSTPANLTVSETLNLIRDHFGYSYKNVSGASRLPNIAIYAAYKSVIDGNQARYKNKSLCPLDSHTAADSSTGSIGDIQINDENEQPLEGLEIKAKNLSSEMIDIAYAKIQTYGTVERYYILSTVEDIDNETLNEITKKISKIRSKHGCEVIVNGVFTTLRYFLRLVDSSTFIRFYVEQIENDDALKYEHKLAWNEICSNL